MVLKKSSQDFLHCSRFVCFFPPAEENSPLVSPDFILIQSSLSLSMTHQKQNNWSIVLNLQNYMNTLSALKSKTAILVKSIVLQASLSA